MSIYIYPVTVIYRTRTHGEHLLRRAGDGEVGARKFTGDGPKFRAPFLALQSNTHTLVHPHAIQRSLIYIYLYSTPPVYLLLSSASQITYLLLSFRIHRAYCGIYTLMKQFGRR